MLVSDSHLFGAFASIELYQNCPILSTVAWVISFAELIEFSYHIVKVLSVEVSEDNGKFSLHFLQLD
jgi:hypothetical protein